MNLPKVIQQHQSSIKLIPEILVKSKNIFICQNCVASASKWMGKCQECGEWNTFVEEIVRKVGYEDVGTFRQLFKRIAGLAPNQYRKKYTFKLAHQIQVQPL